MPGDAREQAWAPPGPLTALADPLLLKRSQESRRVLWPAAPIEQPAIGLPFELACVEPAMPPPMGGRRRDAEGGRGHPQRRSSLNRSDQGEPSCLGKAMASVIGAGS